MKTPGKVDSLIVGGGLTGLILLSKLKEQGQNCLLIEKSPQIGGTFIDILQADKKEADQEDFPKIELSALRWLKNEEKDEETSCLSLGKKGLIPFVGFGESKIPAFEIAESFTHSSSDILQSSSDLPLTTDQIEDLKKSILTYSEITRLYFDEANEKIASCELNGKDHLHFNKIYWTAPMESLCELFPKDRLSDFKVKVKKAKSWDGMSIQFQADEESFEGLKDLKENKLILFGEEDHPWLGGVIYDSEDLPKLTFSSFYDSTLSQDHDFIRKHLKTLKRQVRKIYPHLFEEEQIHLFSEDKITFHTAVASNLKVPKKALKEELEAFEFFCAHHNFYPEPLAAKLNQAQQLFQDTSPKKEAPALP